MLGNIAEQNTPDSAIVNTNCGKNVIAKFDAHKLRTIAPGDPVCVEPTGNDKSPFYWITSRSNCNYYRRYWDADSGGLCADWGGSTFLFETHEDGWVARQIQLFDNGHFVLYDEIVAEDKYGGRSTVPLDLTDFEHSLTTPDDFFHHWEPDTSINRGINPENVG